MKFYEIAFKNVRGNLYRYIMYYLSNVLSVMLFFLFANFIFHPAVTNLGASGSTMLYTIGEGLEACEYVIIVFSFFFVNYSNSTFIKSRGREFGLLSLFGMTKNQVRKYVAYENTIVSLFSIIIGVVLGGLFSKLFFMAVEAALETGPIIEFMIVPKAVIVTVVSFFILFQVISLLSLRKINKKTIVTQLKSSKVPKALPRFSKTLAIVGVVMVAAGYVMAWISGIAIIVTMFPILFLTVLGTYFLLTQFSIAVTRGLQKRKGVFYKKTNMIVISQIVYKLKDNAKVLFLVAILGAVTLTAAGTLYALFDLSQEGIREMVPQHISFTGEGANSHNVIAPEKVDEILNKHNIKVESQFKVEGIRGAWTAEGEDTKGKVLAISCSDYNKRAKALGMKNLDIRGSDIAVIKLYKWMSNPDELNININGEIKKNQIVDSFYGKILSSSAEQYAYIAVLNDEYYNSMMENVNEGDITSYYGYNIDNWKAADNAMTEISRQIPEDYKGSFFQAISDYSGVVKTQAITMLIGLFVALLFLIATGSIIYFKLFTELQQDRAEYVSLMKMGMSRGEMKRIVNTQMIVIFFLPFVICASHASFALKTLSDLLQKNLVGIGVMVVSVYLVFQLVYFIFINLIYKSQINTIE